MGHLFSGKPVASKVSSSDIQLEYCVNLVSSKPVPEFNSNSELASNISSKCKDWMDGELRNVPTARGVADRSYKEANDLCQSGFRAIATAAANNYETATIKVLEYVEPLKNRRYEEYCSRKATQEILQKLDRFHSCRKSLAKNCKFHACFEEDKEIVEVNNYVHV